MNTSKISIISKDNKIIESTTWKKEHKFLYKNEYSEGDKVRIEIEEKGNFFLIRLDETMDETPIFIYEDIYEFSIPFNEALKSYSQKSFHGDRHYITVKAIEKKDLSSNTNLVFNPFDQAQNTYSFPHSYANVETRGESVFASRNTIDGVFANDDHGYYPYNSWGINRDKKAEISYDLLTKAIVNEIVITLRADFPHDSYWTECEVVFSNGSTQIFKLEKTSERQMFKVSDIECDEITIRNLIKADDDSPFPALTQFEVYGDIILYD